MSRFNEGDRLQYIARRHNGVFGQRSLDERQEYVVENTSNLGVRINGVWYHEDLFELAPKPIPNSTIEISPEGVRMTRSLVSVRVPPTVDEIRARWNVDYNYDMNMANQAPEDVKTLLDEVDRLTSVARSEHNRVGNLQESLASRSASIDEMSDRIMRLQEERNDALSRLSSVEDMILQWDSTADVSIEDMQAMLLEQVNGK